MVCAKKGPGSVEFGEKWLDDFTEDYITICGEDQADRMRDDIKAANIGRTRDGKILCFDWYDPFIA